MTETADMGASNRAHRTRRALARVCLALASLLVHGALWFALARVQPPPEPDPPSLTPFTLEDVSPDDVVPRDEQPRPPEVAGPIAEPLRPPAPVATPRTARARPPAPAEVPSRPPGFGVELGNDAPGAPTGSAGAPGGEPGGKDRQITERRTRTLAPKASTPERCAEAEVKPRPVALPQPQYTEAARAASVQGKVRVQLTVEVDGTVRDAKVVSPLDPGLDAAALAAVRAARFTPATRCGEPVAATLTIAITFSL